MRGETRNFGYERGRLGEGFDFVVGVDEVGRGPLAGPLVIAAAVFNVNHTAGRDPWFNNVKDSKKLSAKKREELSLLIQSDALAINIVEYASEMVDEQNIHMATLNAMHEAVKNILECEALKNKNVFCVFDGKFVPPNFSLKGEAVTGGDDKIFSISSASIIAKVYRDSLMMKHSDSFPEYGFSRNKGYGTGEHIEAIKKHGLTPLHRVTFCKNFV